jgi:hypothetical protein
MLSLEECREILGEEAPADERQLEELRENAYRLARLLMELYRDQKASKNGLPTKVGECPPDDVE